MARLQTRNRGTSIFPREAMSTMTTHPLPSKARRNTIHTEHLRVHQSNRSLQGKNGPGVGKHWIPGLGVAIPAPGITVAGVQILMVSQKSLEVELVFVQMISE